jgi:hypothetical protein
MTRNLRLLILALIALSSTVAFTAIALKTGAIPAPPGLDFAVGPLPRRGVPVMLFVPVWMALGWGMIEIRNARRSVKPARDFVRISALGFVAAAVMCLVVELWLADILLTGVGPGRYTMIRLMTLFLGGLFAVQGNFLAKSSPPTGAKAPEPSRWTRYVLRVGWVMVVTGLALAVCAFALPVQALMWATPIATVILLANVLANRRTLWPAGPERASTETAP